MMDETEIAEAYWSALRVYQKIIHETHELMKAGDYRSAREILHAFDIYKVTENTP